MPRTSRADWKRQEKRRDLIAILKASNRGRLPQLEVTRYSPVMSTGNEPKITRRGLFGRFFAFGAGLLGPSLGGPHPAASSDPNESRLLPAIVAGEYLRENEHEWARLEIVPLGRDSIRVRGDAAWGTKRQCGQTSARSDLKRVSKTESPFTKIRIQRRDMTIGWSSDSDLTRLQSQKKVGFTGMV